MSGVTGKYSPFCALDLIAGLETEKNAFIKANFLQKIRIFPEQPYSV